jgi:probable rRNA maturation factor
MIEIEISNRQISQAFEAERLTGAARMVLSDEGIRRGTVSIAVMDDPSIRQLNCQYLQHDYATDVLSFLLESGPHFLEGQIVVSADTAARMAPQFGWSVDDELLLYVIHGVLHLVGYDDVTPEAQDRMRSRERQYLKRFDIEPPEGEDAFARENPVDSELRGDATE